MDRLLPRLNILLFLYSNTAGSAMNAEDFTKEFMAQLTGGGGPGGQNWTPNVTPVGQMPAKPSQPGQTFTKTSLAADKQVS